MANRPHAESLTAADFTLISKALADPRRYEILERIAAGPGPVSCSDLLAAVAISPATMSHHMKELDTAGLILTTREGRFMRCTPNRPRLQAFVARLKSDLI